MLPITILQKTENSILYGLPAGKPNPHLKCNKGEDVRSRVLQTGAKGAACWYYTFNFIRLRIGKNPCSDLRQERALEEICSRRRKEQKAFDDMLPFSIDELYSKSDSSILEKLDLENAQTFLDNLSSASCILSENIEVRLSLTHCIKEFLNEKTHKNLHEFLIFKRSSKTIEINLKFLQNFKTDVHKMLEHQNWEKLDIENKAAALDAYVRDCHADFYKLKKSSWKPLQGIEKLCDELKEKGPLMVLGDFGTSAYTDQPFKMSQQINSRDIYAWHPGAERNQALAGHSVLLIGAKKIKDNAFVYFIDPSDSSDPLDQSKQKIYLISFKNFTSNIYDITGRQNPDSRSEYAYCGSFKY